MKVGGIRRVEVRGEIPELSYPRDRGKVCGVSPWHQTPGAQLACSTASLASTPFCAKLYSSVCLVMSEAGCLLCCDCVLGLAPPSCHLPTGERFTNELLPSKEGKVRFIFHLHFHF